MEVLERAEVPNDLTAAVEKNDYVHVAAYLQSHPCLDLSATLKVSGNGLLHMAASRDAADTVRLLLACGASPRLRNKAGNTPLHEASSAGACAAITALLEAARDTVLLRNAGEQTALHLASAAGHEAAAALLLTRGAPLEALDGKGCTPLSVARVGGQREVVRLLSDAGAFDDSAAKQKKGGKWLACISPASGTPEALGRPRAGVTATPPQTPFTIAVSSGGSTVSTPSPAQQQSSEIPRQTPRASASKSRLQELDELTGGVLSARSRARSGLPPPSPSPCPVGRLSFVSEAVAETSHSRLDPGSDSGERASSSGGERVVQLTAARSTAPLGVAEVALSASAEGAARPQRAAASEARPERLEARLAAVEAALGRAQSATAGDPPSGAAASLEERLAAIESRQQALFRAEQLRAEQQQHPAQQLPNVSFGSAGFSSPPGGRWRPHGPSSIDGVDGESSDPLPPRSESPWGGLSPDGAARGRRTRGQFADPTSPPQFQESLPGGSPARRVPSSPVVDHRRGSRVQEEMLVGMLHAAAEGAAAQIAAAKMEAASHLAAAAAAEASLQEAQLVLADALEARDAMRRELQSAQAEAAARFEEDCAAMRTQARLLRRLSPWKLSLLRANYERQNAALVEEAQLARAAAEAAAWELDAVRRAAAEAKAQADEAFCESEAMKREIEEASLRVQAMVAVDDSGDDEAAADEGPMPEIRPPLVAKPMEVLRAEDRARLAEERALYAEQRATTAEERAARAEAQAEETDRRSVESFSAAALAEARASSLELQLAAAREVIAELQHRRAAQQELRAVAEEEERTKLEAQEQQQQEQVLQDQERDQGSELAAMADAVAELPTPQWQALPVVEPARRGPLPESLEFDVSAIPLEMDTSPCLRDSDDEPGGVSFALERVRDDTVPFSESEAEGELDQAPALPALHLALTVQQQDKEERDLAPARGSGMLRGPGCVGEAGSDSPAGDMSMAKAGERQPMTPPQQAHAVRADSGAPAQVSAGNSTIKSFAEPRVWDAEAAPAFTPQRFASPAQPPRTADASTCPDSGSEFTSERVASPETPSTAESNSAHLAAATRSGFLAEDLQLDDDPTDGRGSCVADPGDCSVSDGETFDLPDAVFLGARSNSATSAASAATAPQQSVEGPGLGYLVERKNPLFAPEVPGKEGAGAVAGALAGQQQQVTAAGVDASTGRKRGGVLWLAKQFEMGGSAS